MGAAVIAGGGGAAATVQAIRASGVLVRVEPDAFLDVLRRQQGPLVVYAPGWFFGAIHQYLTSYKGLGFFTWAYSPLGLPSGVELVQAQSISIPG